MATVSTQRLRLSGIRRHSSSPVTRLQRELAVQEVPGSSGMATLKLYLVRLYPYSATTLLPLHYSQVYSSTLYPTTSYKISSEKRSTPNSTSSCRCRGYIAQVDACELDNPWAGGCFFPTESWSRLWCLEICLGLRFYSREFENGEARFGLCV